jgi:hypothetical protein
MEVTYIKGELSKRIAEILQVRGVPIAEPKRHETASGGTHIDSHVVTVVDVTGYGNLKSAQSVVEYLAGQLSNDPALKDKVVFEKFVPIHQDACALPFQVDGAPERVVLRRASVYD